MSLYNHLFGFNDKAALLLGCLGIDVDSIPRFRDAFLIKDFIVIHTRTGGGNRDYYEKETCRSNHPEYFEGNENPLGPWNDDLRAHPCFVKDEDDNFDPTYANFYYKYPEDYAEKLKIIAQEESDQFPAEKWQALFKSMEKSK